jgi:hypothetical protein
MPAFEPLRAMGPEVRQSRPLVAIAASGRCAKTHIAEGLHSLAAVGLLRGAISLQSHVAPALVPLFDDALGLSHLLGTRRGGRRRQPRYIGCLFSG